MGIIGVAVVTMWKSGLGWFCGCLGWGCMMAALIFNIINAINLWGLLGGVFAFGGFPIMFFIVPIVLLMEGEWPIYWLLLPVGGLLIFIASRLGLGED